MLSLQQRNMFKKRKSAIKSDPKKSWSGIKMEARVESKEGGLEVILVGIN